MLTLITKIMFPELHSQAYREFFSHLQRLQHCLAEIETEPQVFWEAWQEVELFYRQEIYPLTKADLTSEVLPLRLSVSREIHRTIELLATDLLFLRSARQTVTKQKRIGSIEAHVERLISYCQVILNTN
jgi:hypothetical protein